MYLHRQTGNNQFERISWEEITKPFQAYLNALFVEDPINATWIREASLTGPMMYGDGDVETYARVKNPTVRRMEQAEETIGPFFQWLKENRASVDAVGDMIRYAYEQFKRAEYQTKRGETNPHALDVARVAEESALAFIAAAQRIEVNPPKTDRATYFR